MGSCAFSRWVWCDFLGLPLGEVRWDPKHFPADKRFIFASHPHGVASLHHIGLMMTPASCEPGKVRDRVSVGEGGVRLQSSAAAS